MENVLTVLNNAQMYDDERNTINRNEIEKVIRRLEQDVNVFGFKPDKIYKDFEEEVLLNNDSDDADGVMSKCRYAENMLFYIALHWIKFWGNAEKGKIYGRFYAGIDGRNEIAVKRCAEIAAMDDFNQLYKYYGHDLNFDKTINFVNSEDVLEDYYKYLLERTNTLHKTNMQTATQLMIYAVSEANNDNSRAIKNALTEKYFDRYYSMPMI